MNYLEYFIYFNVSIIVRLLLVFMPMMLYYNWVDKEGTLWKLTKYPWYFAAGLFYAADVVYNYYMTIYTFDSPKRLGEPVTERLTRYATELDGTGTLIERFRHWLGVFFCKILHQADPGHCGGFPR